MQLIKYGLCGLASLTITLVLWVLLVSLLDRRTALSDDWVWLGSLYGSAFAGACLIAFWQAALRPSLSISIVFAVFGLAYFALEGPVFGEFSQGGDPQITTFVYYSLLLLPLCAFLAAEVGIYFRFAANDASNELSNELSSAFVKGAG